nr:DNA repair helicase XPD [Tanacetum cinerariifolium]
SNGHVNESYDVPTKLIAKNMSEEEQKMRVSSFLNEVLLKEFDEDGYASIELLMEYGVYESAEEIAKREEILLRIEQVVIYWYMGFACIGALSVNNGRERNCMVDVIISFLSSRKDLRLNEEVVSKENQDLIDVECRKLLVSWVRGTAVTDKRVKMFKFLQVCIKLIVM